MNRFSIHRLYCRPPSRCWHDADGKRSDDEILHELVRDLDLEELSAISAKA
ncbi:hypothetical protein [Rhizobium etli]|nr:hypothetical protein [Rhizobium sp. IE4771]